MIRRHLPQTRDAAAAIAGVDQRLRETLQLLWLALPADRANWEELEAQFRRLSERALKDLQEDFELFPQRDENRY